MVRLTVRAHPRSSRRQLRWDGETLELWVTSAPTDGAANLAVITALADWLDVPRSAIRLVSGLRSRTKVVAIDGLDSLPPPN